MLIERQAGLAEVLPWLWPLADEDSGCTVHAAPSLQTRLLAALIAVPEGMDNALGGKVSLVNILHARLLLLAEGVSFGIVAESRLCRQNVLLYSCTTLLVWKAIGTSKLIPFLQTVSEHRWLTLRACRFQIKLCAGGTVAVHPASCLVIARPS